MNFSINDYVKYTLKQGRPEYNIKYLDYKFHDFSYLDLIWIFWKYI